MTVPEPAFAENPMLIVSFADKVISHVPTIWHSLLLVVGATLEEYPFIKLVLLCIIHKIKVVLAILGVIITLDETR